MRHDFAVILLNVAFVLASISIDALSVPIQNASLIWRAEGPCASYDCLQEYIYPLPEPAQRGEGVMLVRIDSDLPLALAVATASVPPNAIADWMHEIYNFNRVDVLIGRVHPRATTAARYSPMELWWAPSRDKLPVALDVVNSNRVVVQRIGVRPEGLSLLPFEGSPDYVGSIDHLVTELRRRPSAVGVVNGYYLERPTKALSRRLRACERLLSGSGLGRNRFVVRHIRWPGEWTVEPPDPEPVRPSVFLYEILPETPVPSTAQSNFGLQRSAHNRLVQLLPA